MRSKLTTNKEWERKQRAMQESLNPAPGRSSYHSRIIRDTLFKIEQEALHWLEATDYKVCKGFLPYIDYISPRDEDWAQDVAAIYNNSQVDDVGQFIHMPGIVGQERIAMKRTSVKATNRIHVITWYSSDQGKFQLNRNIYSPLPCSRWGALPLTEGQWRIIATALCAAHAFWQWVPAVQHYFGDTSFRYGGLHGWDMPRCERVQHLDETTGYVINTDAEKASIAAGEFQGWIGRIIFKSITDEFLRRVEGV